MLNEVEYTKMELGTMAWVVKDLETVWAIGFGS